MNDKELPDIFDLDNIPKEELDAAYIDYEPLYMAYKLKSHGEEILEKYQEKNQLNMATIIKQGECLQDESTMGLGLEMHYTLTDDGTLTISGQGVLGTDVETEEIEMTTPDGDEYGEDIEHRLSQFKGMDVRRVVIEEGVAGLSENSLSKLPMTEVILPDGLSLIDTAAFSGCENLVTVNIPGSVSTLGHAVFELCSSLREIKIPEGITELVSTFMGCTNLKKVTLPGTLERIGSTTFASCSSLESIEMNSCLVEIGESAFRECQKLKRIVIPEGVTVIPFSAFEGCKSLEYISLPGSLQEIEPHAFSECSSLADIEVKSPLFYVQGGCLCSRDGVVIAGLNQEEIIIPDGITEVAPGAFSYRDRIKDIRIPDTLDSYGIHSFEGTSVTKLVIPGRVKTVGFNAFKDCHSLRELVIPEGVEDISNSFDGCTSLQEVVVPKSVMNCPYAFHGCTSLTKVTFLPCSEDVEMGNAFASCTSLKDIVLSDGLKVISCWAFDSCESLESIDIPDSVVRIENGAFSGCTALRHVRLSENVEISGWHTFAGCPCEAEFVRPKPEYQPAKDDDGFDELPF